LAGPTLRAFRTRFLLALFRAIAGVGERLSLKSARRCGRALGFLAWHVARRERRRALENIALAFPEWDSRKHRETIRAMFAHLGMSLFEIVWLPNLRKGFESTTIVEGHEPLMKLMSEGRSIVAYTGHCGNWEWVAYIVALLGFPLTALQRERDESEVNEFIRDLRATAGIRTIDRGSVSSGREMIQALRKPGLLAFLIDQNIRTESVKVPFFGRPAPTPIGPAKLNVRAEAVAVSIFIERREDGMQLVRFMEPIETKRTDDPVALTALITSQIEAQIRRRPEQWVWMHDRWKDRPKWDVTQD
jgi:Kdo2-lipid IVA lauroyltransferase/acyltransferase